jgi:hypothetical protein
MPPCNCSCAPLRTTVPPCPSVKALTVTEPDPDTMVFVRRFCLNPVSLPPKVSVKTLPAWVTPTDPPTPPPPMVGKAFRALEMLVISLPVPLYVRLGVGTEPLKLRLNTVPTPVRVRLCAEEMAPAPRA